MKLPAFVARTGTVAAVTLLSFVTLDASPRSGNEGVSTTAIQPARVSIDNFGRISDTYYRGAQPTGDDYADLAKLGIRTVINLTSDDALAEEPGMVTDAGMKYVALPMTTRVPPTAAQLAKFFEIVNDPARQPVYVHCVGGKHRTGVMTAVYRMTQESWTADQAFNEMKKFKFGASMLHPEFKQFVYKYKVPVREAAATLPTVLALETP
jgi:protein tyrosine/serine phosphatase